MSRHTITLDNFQGWSGEVSGVEIASNLELPPYVPTTEIVVDLGRIARVGRVGRLRTIHLGQFSEYEDRHTPGVNSIEADGSATATITAAKTKVKRVSIATEKDGYDDMGHSSANISLNLSHPDLDNGSLREAQNWASILDSGTREGLRSASIEHIIKNRDLSGKFFGAYWASLLTGDILRSTMVNDYKYFVSDIGIIACVNIASGGIRKAVTGKLDYEWSLTPGMAIDRVAIVQALTRTQKLVKAKKLD